MSEEQKVTSLEEIKNKAERIVPICGFEPGETINIKIRRASLIDLIEREAIPNELLSFVKDMLGEKKDKDKKNKGERFNPVEDYSPEEFKQFISVIDAACAATVVEPSYDELRPYLTDRQKIEIYYYAQYGLKVLRSFRGQQDINDQDGGDSQGVQPEAK